MFSGIAETKRIASSQLVRWVKKHEGHEVMLTENLAENMQRGFYCCSCRQGAECAVEDFEKDKTLKRLEARVMETEDAKIVRRPLSERMVATLPAPETQVQAEVAVPLQASL
jgi:predicted RNA-binding protein YlxR (DUF448 family)